MRRVEKLKQHIKCKKRETADEALSSHIRYYVGKVRKHYISCEPSCLITHNFSLQQMQLILRALSYIGIPVQYFEKVENGVRPRGATPFGYRVVFEGAADAD